MPNALTAMSLTALTAAMALASARAFPLLATVAEADPQHDDDEINAALASLAKALLRATAAAVIGMAVAVAAHVQHPKP